jgi:hypothetical protein
MTTLQFTLPSNPGCAPLACGVGNQAFIPLVTASAPKSADGSGYLLATITAVLGLSLTSWRYTVEIEDSEIADGETVTANDVTGRVCCVSCADAALLAKLTQLNPENQTPLNWQTFALFAPAAGVITSAPYLFRRQTSVRLHAIEAAIVSGQGPVSLTLERTAANGVNFTTPFTSALAINGSGIYTARLALSVPVIIPAFCAVRASISSAASLYETTANGLDLHLITSEI